MRFTVARKLWLAFAIVLVLLVAVAGLGVYSMNAARFAAAELVEIHGAVEALDRGVEQLLLESTNTVQYLMTKDENYLVNARACRSRFFETWVDVRRYGEKYGMEDVEDMEEQAIAYHSLLDGSIRNYQENPGDIAAALTQVQGSEFYLHVLGPVRDTLYEDMEGTVQATEASVEYRLRVMLVAVAVAGILALVVAAVSAYLISRGITRAARHLAAAARSISLGDLDVLIEVKTGDEMQDLADSIELMRTSLKSAIERLRRRSRAT